MEKLRIELTQEQVQYIVGTLDMCPHREVRELIDTVVQQANEQLNRQEVVAE